MSEYVQDLVRRSLCEGDRAGATTGDGKGVAGAAGGGEGDGGEGGGGAGGGKNSEVSLDDPAQALAAEAQRTDKRLQKLLAFDCDLGNEPHFLNYLAELKGAGFTVGRQSKYVRERQGDGDADAPPAAADAPVEVAV